MKVRVKFGRESHVLDFDQQGPSDITLRVLRQTVSSHFNLAEHNEFQLSLNKYDALSGEDQTLDNFGIVSGDILHIIGTSLSQTRNDHPFSRQQPLMLHPYQSSDNIQQPDQTVSLKSDEGQAQSSSDGSISFGTSDDPHLHDSVLPDVNRYLLEPLVVRESTESQVPVLLSQLYQSANCFSKGDALWVILHTLMLESGFSPSESQDPTIMPKDWKFPQYYSCSYDYAVTPDSVDSCSVIGVIIGSSVIVHASVKSNPNFKTEHLQFRCADFVQTLSQDVAASYRALDRLSRLFKDTVCMPVINEIVTAAGFQERQGLQALPYETKLRVISFLDARSLCHLGQTCLEFNAMYRDKTVWRILYIREFGKPDDCSLARNWYELFKLKYQQFKEEQERRRRVIYLDETDPPWGFPRSGHFRPLHPGLPFPHMIGGDYDLNPVFNSGIMNPLGAGRQGGPVLPQANNIPDPLFPGPGNLGLPGRPRPGTGNLTGSPFSDIFRGPFI